MARPHVEFFFFFFLSGCARPVRLPFFAFVTDISLLPEPPRQLADGRGVPTTQWAEEKKAANKMNPNKLRAVDAVCPHSDGPLADGQFDAKKVICPLHNYFFSLADGTCLNGDYAVRTYPVREEAGDRRQHVAAFLTSRTQRKHFSRGRRPLIEN